jgi:integrase
MGIDQLAAHYESNEMPGKAYSTTESYRQTIEGHILPTWGKRPLSSILGVEVEKWLKNHNRLDGKPASPSLKTKIRNVMSAFYAHAIRNGWASNNPITSVRTSSERLVEPDLLTPEEVRALLQALEQRERDMVLVAASTGVRRGELIALRWADIDLKTGTVYITKSVWRNVEGNTKTRASKKPLPIPRLVANALKEWRTESLYREDQNFVFPSDMKNGEVPIAPDMILRRHIRSALKQLGITKKIGWHSFRHGFADLLRTSKVELKTTQELLRHANPMTTARIYQQTVTEERGEAQSIAFKARMGA